MYMSSIGVDLVSLPVSPVRLDNVSLFIQPDVCFSSSYSTESSANYRRANSNENECHVSRRQSDKAGRLNNIQTQLYKSAVFREGDYNDIPSSGKSRNTSR